MATRFYLASTITAPVTPASYDPAWTNTGSSADRALLRAADSGETLSTVSQSWAAADVALSRRFVSEPIAAQTLGGGGSYVYARVRARELALADDVIPYLGIRIFSGDGLTLRGTLLAAGNYNTGLELSTTLENVAFAIGGLLSSVVALDGDRIVVEIGFSVGGGGAPATELRIGAPTSTDDLPFGASTDDFLGWVELAPTVLFRPMTGSENRTLEVGLGRNIPAVKTFTGSENRTLETNLAADRTGPFVRNMDPFGITECAPAGTEVSFQIGTLLPRLVDLSSLVVSYSQNGATPIVVYDGGLGGFQTGYSGTVDDVSTGLLNLYDVTFSLPSTVGGIIDVFVLADDDLGDPITPPVDWQFCLVAEAFYVLIPDVTDRDGGHGLTLTSDALVDGTYRVIVEGTAMYSGVAGAGDTVTALGGSLSFVTRRLPIGGPYTLVLERITGGGAATATTAALLYVLPRQFESSLFSLRSLLPRSFRLGIREATLEPFPQ